MKETRDASTRTPSHLLRNLEERVARHVLDARVQLVHELEQLVHHGPEELPVGLKEAGVLPHDVHDVGGHHGLVVLAALHLAQVQQVLPKGRTIRTYARYHAAAGCTLRSCQ